MDLVAVASAVATLALDVLDDRAFDVLATSRGSFARLSDAGLACVRERAAAMRLSAAQASLSSVRRARHVGLSNCLVHDAGKKRSNYSPERLALGLDLRDMAALCLLVESLDGVQGAVFELERQRSADALSAVAKILAAHSLPAAGSDAALLLGPDDVPRARAAIRTAAHVIGGDPSSAAASPTLATISGQDALRALRDNLQLLQPEQPARREASAARPVPTPPAMPEALTEHAMEDRSAPQRPPPPGFAPLSPERRAPLPAPASPRVRAVDRPDAAAVGGKRKRAARAPALPARSRPGSAGAAPNRAPLAGVADASCNQGRQGSILAFFVRKSGQ